MLEIIGGMIVLLIMITLSGLKVVKEHERLVVYRYGKVVGSRGPGLVLIIPVIERALEVDTRIVTMPIEADGVVTGDDTSVNVSAVFMFQVVDPASFVTKVADAYEATRQAAETALRDACREHKLGEIQADKRRVNQRVKTLLEKKIKLWGLKITSVELKDVDTMRSIGSDMGRRVQEEREARARVLSDDIIRGNNLD